MDLPNISLIENFDELNIPSRCSSKSDKNSYKTRKLENRLKKYEFQLKACENITRLDTPDRFLFAGNCGLDNNVLRGYLEETFIKYGPIIDIIMEQKKPYSFIVYEQAESVAKAINDLQEKEIECCKASSQTANHFYLFAVDRVPTLCEIKCDTLPQGLLYIEDFINETQAKEFIDYLSLGDLRDLKNRSVKHFGYEFRYGTNDVDETKPLEEKIPELFEPLINKFLQEKIISEAPDQLTVNYYEPGHGIAPHVDNTKAFGDYIVSLSLVSSVVMSFRLKEGRHSLKNQIYLKPNSLLVLKSDARYKWSHSIAERKHDLVLNEKGKVEIKQRDRRISLTFRKVSNLSKSKPEISEIQLPDCDQAAIQFEKKHVHTVYNQIAEHFSSTRHSAWPGVVKFVHSISKNSLLIDIGCGNGKYLNLRNDIFAFGCDYSTELISICYKRNFNCLVSNCLSLPCKSNYFDCALSIAVIHHLSTQKRRLQALLEMIRVLKVGGRGLVTVWAQEQKLDDKESYYIHKKSKNKRENAFSKEIEVDSSVHEYGNEFKKQDLFVTWNSKKQNDEKSNEVFLRFYHVFKNKELDEFFKQIPEAKIVESFYEQGNWCIIFEKIK